MTFEAGNEPLVVIRGADGALRCFYNLCRHRGVRLLEGVGTLERGVTCFYHCWRYGLDGQLLSLPQPDQFPGLRREALGLKPASVAVSNGMVFVNPASHPPPLAEWLGGMDDHMSPWRPSELLEAEVKTTTVRANWKLFVENHIDGYHLWYLHAASVTGLDHSRQAWREIGRHWAFYEPPSERGVSPDRYQFGTPIIDGVPEDKYGSTVWWVTPNLAGAAGATFWSAVKIIPVAPDETRIEVRTRIGGPPDLEPTAGGSLEQIVNEDIRAVEAIQRAMSSAEFEVGPMSRDYEGSIEAFHRNILALMKDSAA
jgi:Rieske 2Fe-2S family protein